MAWGRRCDIGCESWPDEVLYKTCPECGQPTERFSNLRPLDSDEALSILLHKQFETYYERRCARLGIPADGPLPDTPDVIEDHLDSHAVSQD
jgi:hypothetical protein